ncbi:THUMP domain-containing protein [Candidatus Bathyarchaeota archaeon]|nr:THUMP domain-containing protein [Candidatus Bathyarchaeota archaeon]
MKYNLLATTDQLNLSQACSELWMNLRAVGDERPKVDRSRVKGLVLAYTNLDPIEAVHLLREHMKAEPSRHKAVYRLMPIHTWVETDVETIVETVRSLIGRIGEEESFRITLEKRRTQLSSLEVIDPVAKAVDRRVDLGNPDWVVLIEILGTEAGVSVIKPSDMLNVQKERYRLSTEGQ